MEKSFFFFNGYDYSVQTDMNGSSHPKHENRIPVFVLVRRVNSSTVYFQGKTYFMRYYCPPSSQPCPVGGGGACDAQVFPVHKNAGNICTGNTTLSQPGRPSGGAEPLERQVIHNDFNRADKP
jgi:hypothetical protein